MRFLKRLLCVCVLLCGLAYGAFYIVLPKVLPLKYENQVEKFSTMYDVEPSLVYAVIFCESRFNLDAHSRAGAQGLMQVTQETGWWAADRIDLLDPDNLALMNPDTNIAM